MKLLEITQQVPWVRNPKIGWWLDRPIVRFYHGTHKQNIEKILKLGIKAPSSGPTANWVSLALEPNTAFGYASMTGGESEFRAAGAKPKTVPPEDRVVFILDIPQKYFLPKMAEARGAMDNERDKLTNKQRYLDWKEDGGEDQLYYAITEIRLPKLVPVEFITGYTVK